MNSRTDLAGGLAFVLLCSTGYIAAAFGLQGSGPFTLAAGRFAGTVLLIGAWLIWRRAAQPTNAMRVVHAMVAGVLLHAGFFGFTYAGLRVGVPAAAAGLICGLMPLVTALIAALVLGETLNRRAPLGLALGFAGVLLVVLPDLQGRGGVIGYGFLGLALLSLSGGTVYQKRFVGGLDPRLSLLAQVSASLLVMLPFAAGLEHLEVHPNRAFLGGLAWVVLVNSCMGLLLYLWLLGRGAAGRVASLFYLVPPVTAALAALVLGSRFHRLDALGFALAAAGVWLGQRRD